MIRILHAADLHMDSPFQGLTAPQAALRRREQRGLLDRLCALAEDSGAQLLLLAGDLLDSDSPYAETGATLCAALARLRIPVLLAPGNHDFYSRRSPYARLPLPENVRVFTAPRLSCRELAALGVRVWGAGYTDSVCPPLLRGFRAPREEDWLNILLLHAEVTAAPSRYCPVTEAELAASGMDYAALGHVHSFSGLRRAGDCFYAWPGCPEGRGFDETGEKGVVLADLARGRCEARFVPLGARRYELLEAPVEGDALASVLRALPGDTSRDIYRIILRGESDGTPIDALREALEDRFFALQLRDERCAAGDLWRGAGETGLRGHFLALMRARYDAAPDERARELVRLAVRAGLAALEGGEAF